jgi:signal recognition particle subunit SRP54
MMRQMMSMSMWQKMKMLTGLNKAGAFLPGSGLLGKMKGDTGHRKSAKERAEERKKKRKRGR